MDSHWHVEHPGITPWCTCEPGPRASDGSENGPCAYCEAMREDEEAQADTEALAEAHLRDQDDEDFAL